jgi:hypothetical protein
MTAALLGRLRQLAGQWMHRKLPPAAVEVPDRKLRLRWDGEKIDVQYPDAGEWVTANNLVLTAYLDALTHIGLLSEAVESAERARLEAARADREACRVAALAVHAALDAIGCPKAGEEP